MDSNIKQYEEIRKSTTRQGEDYTAGCLIDQDYIKNHYRLIAVDLSRKKELDAYPKVIQKLDFAGELKTQMAMTMLQMTIMINLCLS